MIFKVDFRGNDFVEVFEKEVLEDIVDVGEEGFRREEVVKELKKKVFVLEEGSLDVS